MGKCAIINVGFEGFKPMTEYEFLTLKEGDEVVNSDGEKGFVIGMNPKNFVMVKTNTSKRFFGYWEIMKIK